jgi:uncharacterized protein (TIGR02186 family)
VFVAVQWAFCTNAYATLTATANHDHISIDFMYRGSTVSVKGEADAGKDLVVTITSPDGHQSMKKKGKVGGLLWMNVGSLDFERAPNLYEVFSTRRLEDILSAEARAEHVIGYEALLKHVNVQPAQSEQEKATWFGELVKMKEASKLYVASSGRIATKVVSGGRQSYELMTDWPHQAPPGEYTVTVYAVKDGRVSEQAKCKVRVEQVGVVKALASMARDSAALYGIVSIAIALGAGFGVGMIAKKGGGAH